jgi:transposase-like protein
VFIKIDGRLVYLWRAGDAEGEVLDVLVQSKRDKRSALKLMRKLLMARLHVILEYPIAMRCGLCAYFCWCL